MDLNSFKQFLRQYRPSWYLDALFFWAVFSCGAIFVVWLFNMTTKDHMRSMMERRIYSTTQATAKLFDPQMLGVEGGSQDGYPRSYLAKVSNMIEVIRLQSMDVSDIYLMEYRAGKLWIFKSGTRDWTEVKRDTEEYSRFLRPVVESSVSHNFYASQWEFLKNRFLFFFTPLGEEGEFAIYPIEGWARKNPDLNPVAVLIFDSESMRSEFTALDFNSFQVISLAIILATVVSIVTRRRSIQREEAVEERLRAMEMLRKRDAILALVVAAADRFIIQQKLTEPLSDFLKEANRIFHVTSMYLKVMPGEDHSSVGIPNGEIIGSYEAARKHFDLEKLKTPEWEKWFTELSEGHSIIGNAESLPAVMKDYVGSLGIRFIGIIPVVANRRLVAVFIMENHAAPMNFDSGLIDTLNLATRLLGSSIIRHENEIHLRYSSKMEALGRMGSGVAHEFNNLLHIISGNLAQLSSSLKDSPQLSALVENILSTARRGSKIIDQMLRATRQSSTDAEFASLNEIVERTVILATPALGKSITLTTHLNPSIPNVLMDDNLIQQVILNLILNARDAMDGSGNIDVYTGVGIYPRKREHGNYIYCRVVDSGSGIPEKIIESIFDPFFTTKPKGKGTGLGLSTSRGILDLHHGHIEASNHAQGAAFTFYLPVRSNIAEESSKPHETTSSSPLPSHGKKVLLADDEALCVQLVKDMLAENNWETIEAGNGEESLHLARQHASEIEWVITDWTMPGLSEKELVLKLREILPTAKIIVTSGFLLSENLPHECDGFIQKPFQIENLLNLMKEISGRKA